MSQIYRISSESMRTLAVHALLRRPETLGSETWKFPIWFVNMVFQYGLTICFDNMFFSIRFFNTISCQHHE